MKRMSCCLLLALFAPLSALAESLEVVVVRHASHTIDAPRIAVLDAVITENTSAVPLTHSIEKEAMLSLVSQSLNVGAVWALLPSTMHSTAEAAGWVKTHRQAVPLVASLFGLPDNPVDNEVATPGKLTGVHTTLVPTLRDDQAVREYDSHFACVRAVYAGQMDRCITAQGLIDIYASRFSLPPLADHGPRKALPGLGFYASPAVSPETLAQLSRIEFKLLRLGQFVGL